MKKNYAVEDELIELFDKYHKILNKKEGRKLSIEEICKRTKLTRKAYYDAIDSVKMPSKKTLARLARAFELADIGDLIKLFTLNGYMLLISKHFLKDIALAAYALDNQGNGGEIVASYLATTMISGVSLSVSEYEVRSIFDVRRSQWRDADNNLLHLEDIVRASGSSPKSYYNAIKPSGSISKAGLVKICSAFRCTGDELIKVMVYNGYSFPSPKSHKDVLILEIFNQGYDEYDDVENYVDKHLRKEMRT